MAEIVRYRRQIRPVRHAAPASRRRSFGLILLVAGVFFASAALGSLALPHVMPDAPTVASADSISRNLPLCRLGRGDNCVIDGDTFRLDGQPIRIADIDTPESRDYGCAAEKALADRATARMRQLLNAGPFSLAAADRDEDKYGRKLRVVTRDGRSLGQVLVAEGLARSWDGARHPWC